MKQSELQVVRVQHDGLPLVDIDALMNKAIDAKSAVEVMERLQAMRRELRAERAKEAFDAAMAEFQSECPIIVKKKAGAKNAYRYAPLDDILIQVRPLIRQHGFSFAITSEIDKGWVKAVCKITHAQGHSETSEFKAPVDERNVMMTDPQRYGAAMTFAKRYAFANAFGILTADEDTDGGARPKPAGPKTATAATRNFMLEQFKDIHVKMQAYAIDRAIIMPDQGLDEWPLESVPTSKQEMAELRRKIEAHK